MMVGLQGSGKTTTSGKLANLLRKQGKKPLLVACDVYRPAAIKQLQVVGSQLGIEVFSMGDKTNPVDIAKAAVEYAKSRHEELMEELQNIKEAVRPQEILLVVDSMTGQDAVKKNWVLTVSYLPSLTAIPVEERRFLSKLLQESPSSL